MSRSLRTLVVAAALAFVGVAMTADQAAARYPYGYHHSHSAWHSPYGYRGGNFNPSFSGKYGYSSAFHYGYSAFPGMYYPTPRSNVWTGSYYVSPATAMWLNSLR